MSKYTEDDMLSVEEAVDEVVILQEKQDIIDSFQRGTDELSKTLFTKNRDYGNSIFKTELGGVLLRLFDKFERLRAVINNGFTAVEGEPLEDTFKDIGGYSQLGLKILSKDQAFYNPDGTVKGDSDEWQESSWIKELKELIEKYEI